MFDFKTGIKFLVKELKVKDNPFLSCTLTLTMYSLLQILQWERERERGQNVLFCPLIITIKVILKKLFFRWLFNG